jgi:hypothetical protein
MEVSSQLRALAALSPRKEPRYPLDRRLGGPQSRCGHCGEKKNLMSLPGIKPQFFDHPGTGIYSYYKKIHIKL